MNTMHRHVPADKRCSDKGEEREHHCNRTHQTFVRTLFTFGRSEGDERKHHHANEREKRD